MAHVDRPTHPSDRFHSKRRGGGGPGAVWFGSNGRFRTTRHPRPSQPPVTPTPLSSPPDAVQFSWGQSGQLSTHAGTSRCSYSVGDPDTHRQASNSRRPDIHGFESVPSLHCLRLVRLGSVSSLHCLRLGSTLDVCRPSRPVEITPRVGPPAVRLKWTVSLNPRDDTTIISHIVLSCSQLDRCLT